MTEKFAPRFRPVLDGQPVFMPSRAAVSPQGDSFLLAANESPDEPLPSVVGTVAAALGRMNRYPDNTCEEMVGAIARRHRVPVEHVVPGPGSVGLLQMLFEALREPAAEIVYPWRSFEVYPVLARLAGLTCVPVPLRDERHDLDAMRAAVTGRTSLILLCSPNNPTGTVLAREELVRFLDRVPPSCLVLLDEAYHEYVRDAGAADGVELYRDRPNVAVLRTFSKAYGLAGLRVGYLIAHPRVTASVRKTFPPYGVNHVAQAAAVASLAAEDELLARVAITCRERQRVRETLLGMGFPVPVSEANFVWLRLGEETTAFVRTCEERGVNVRAFHGEGVRVTIGSEWANDAFLDAVRAHARRAAGGPPRPAVRDGAAAAT